MMTKLFLVFYTENGEIQKLRDKNKKMISV